MDGPDYSDDLNLVLIKVLSDGVQLQFLGFRVRVEIIYLCFFKDLHPERPKSMVGHISREAFL